MNRRDFLLSTSSLLLAPSALRAQEQPKPASDAKDFIFADFESGTYDGWTLTGNCWTSTPPSDATFPGVITGFQGKFYMGTYHPKLGVAAMGRAVSKEFIIEKPFISFLIGGGNHPGAACMNLVVNGRIVRSQTGDDTSDLRHAEWDVRDMVGQKALLEVLDATSSLMRGYIMIDEVVFSDLPYFVRKAPFNESDRVREVLEQTRVKHDQPAMAACVLLNGRIYAGTAGVRKDGEPDRVTIRDRFRFGSLTKGFVSTMFGSLVESGKARFGMTLKEIFPELRNQMLPDYQEVTLAQVLGHQAGFSRFIQPRKVSIAGKDYALNSYNTNLDFTRQRYEFAKTVELMKPPSHPIGTYSYADAGYVVAAAIASKLTDRSWEQLIQEHVLTPLRMTSSGFNFPEPGALHDFPYQHIFKNGTRTPVAPVPTNSNGPLLDTTGGLYCDMADMGKFLLAHLEGENGRSSILRKETFRLLHNPLPGSDYGLGWNNLHWGNRHVIDHGGGNPFATSHWWLFPAEDYGVCVITTEGGNADAENKAIYEAEGLLEANRSY